MRPSAKTAVNSSASVSLTLGSCTGCSAATTTQNLASSSRATAAQEKGDAIASDRTNTSRVDLNSANTSSSAASASRRIAQQSSIEQACSQVHKRKEKELHTLNGIVEFLRGVEKVREHWLIAGSIGVNSPRNVVRRPFVNGSDLSDQRARRDARP